MWWRVWRHFQVSFLGPKTKIIQWTFSYVKILALWWVCYSNTLYYVYQKVQVSAKQKSHIFFSTWIKCPNLFFCKQLSLVVNIIKAKELRKRTWKYFWPFSCFKIVGQKQHNSDFQVIFLRQNWPYPSEFLFSLKNVKKGEQLSLLSYFDNF